LDLGENLSGGLEFAAFGARHGRLNSGYGFHLVQAVTRQLITGRNTWSRPEREVPLCH
jgi:hypothetical protein